MTSSRPGWTRLALLAALTAVSTVSAGAPAVGATAYRASAASIHAHSTEATDRAQIFQSSTQRLLEGRRRHLARCLARHPDRCARWQTAVERAERRLTLAQTRLNDMRTAPVVTLSGETLSWAPVPGAYAYVLKRRAPGLQASHWLVYGTSVTPPAVPGETVEYLLRTAAQGSEWAPAVTITYPATSPPSGETGSGAGSGSGTGGGSGPGSGSGPGGETPKEEHIKAEEAKAREEKAKEEKAKEEAQKGSSAFETGVVPTTLAESEPSTVKSLGAGSVRMEFPIGAPASALASAVEAYAKVGLKLLPLAGFDGGMPTPAEARNLASWAATYGPGGTFWAGKSYPASAAVTDIEFGNETSYVYQYSENSPAAYAARAQTYALRFKEAEIAVKEVEPAVGLLAQADDGGSGSPAWVQNMFAAVPDLASRVAGWTVHPYGTTWQKKIEDLVNFTAAQGAPSSIPIYVTELGIAVDNGHCVNDNYGWNPCMSDAEAASTLATVVGGMRRLWGSRLKALYLYQAQDEKPEGISNEREYYFGLLQSDGAPKGAFTTEVESIIASGGQAMDSVQRAARRGSPARARAAGVDRRARIAAVRRAARRRGRLARRRARELARRAG